MNQNQKDFCFCTLALGEKYCTLVKELASDLDKYSPGTFLLVYTDLPKLFQDTPNVLAYKHLRQGVDYCYNDKRFAIEKALSKFRAVIFLDADTKIIANIPENIYWPSGITVEKFVKILEHPPNLSTPGRKEAIEKLGIKLGLDLEKVSWVNENLFIVARDEGREKEFIKYWGKIGRYFEVHNVKSKDGNPIGLAAAKVGWTLTSLNWEELDKVREHTFAHWDWEPNKKRTFWEKVSDKLNMDRRKYQYRLMKSKIITLFDFSFYY
ncbi:MAG: hypothetical protein WBV73_25880 [Phormidium sp.]